MTIGAPIRAVMTFNGKTRLWPGISAIMAAPMDTMAPNEAGPGQQQSVIGTAQNAAAEMRRGDADEGDGPAESRHRAHQQCRGQDDSLPSTLEIHAHAAGIILTQQQGVERLDHGARPAVIQAVQCPPESAAAPR